MNEIVPATPEHVAALAPRMREADRQEIAAASGEDPETALLAGVALSPVSWAYLHNGEVLAIYGAAMYPGRPGVGIPWLLGAEGLEKHKVYFVRQSKPYLKKVLEYFDVLENWVDCRNTASIQWLAWCGFALAEVEPFYGIQRLPFIRFCIARQSKET